jgi:hypothetical protein
MTKKITVHLKALGSSGLYRIKSLRNAITVNKTYSRHARVGDQISEEEATFICESKDTEVVVD